MIFFPKLADIVVFSCSSKSLKCLVLVITCLERSFGVISKFSKFSISKFSKIMRVVYPKNLPNQACDYWLTTDQQTLCIETKIF